MRLYLYIIKANGGHGKRRLADGRQDGRRILRKAIGRHNKTAGGYV